MYCLRDDRIAMIGWMSVIGMVTTQIFWGFNANAPIGG
jgi:hypothetical protein